MRSEKPEEREGTSARAPAEGQEGGARREAEAAAAGEAGSPDGAGGAGEGVPAEGEEGQRDEEMQALRDRYLRLAAEYDNFRKRTERERAEAWERAQARLVEGLLDPLDDLQRVAQYSVEATTVESLLEGVRLVERKLLRELESAGLEAMDAQGHPFDPELHDALMTAPTENAEEDDTVGEVFLPGYRFRGTVLRPARVQVRKHGG